MGAYKAAVVTEGGQNLIAQALADKKTVMFTSAKTSSYAYPSGTNIAALTGLRDIVQSVIPSRSQVLNDNVAQVTARFDNDGITQQYLIQTIGLYAQIEDDPEILFSVAQAITPDEMPVHSNISPSAFVYNIHHTVQNAAQIIITVNPAGTATVEDIWSIENPEFDDSGIVEGITSFPDLLDKIRSKMNIFQFYRDLKAGLRFVLHVGQIVDNCTSTDTDKPLAANQGKVLWEKIVEVATALTTHKSSGDHDGRYYTESEVNNLLAAKLSISNIVNNLTSTATNMALSAAQGKALNDKFNQLNSDLGATESNDIGCFKLKNKKLIYGVIRFNSVSIKEPYGNGFWGSVRINIPASFGISNFHAITGTVFSSQGLLSCSVSSYGTTYVDFFIISPGAETRDISVSLLAFAW